MRLDHPRIEPLSREHWDEDVLHIVDPNGDRDDADIFNIFKTLAHYPKLMKRWTVFANHVLMKSSLSPRDREIAILRIGWLCRSEYEWTQHVRIGKNEAKMTDEDIAAVAEGPTSEHWNDIESALVLAVDELHRDAMISDDTWQKLGSAYNRKQMMDLVAAVGGYTLVSMMLNSFGVQLDDSLEPYEGFPQE